ncbi:MAG: ABC transporter substrate-binding protein [Acidimicrobiales bacterium]
MGIVPKRNGAGGLRSRWPGPGRLGLLARPVLAVALVACGAAWAVVPGEASAGAAGSVPRQAGDAHPSLGAALPRDETLYTTGNASLAPRSFNPLDRSSYTGTLGLLYETLFLYDPISNKMVPWLASSGSWSGPSTYTIELRPGVDWVESSSGAAVGTLSGADVMFSLRLAMADKADPWHEDVGSVQSVSASGDLVTVHFGAPVNYAEWHDYLWHAPVLPAAVWSKLHAAQAATATNLSPMATGPMLLYSTSSGGACYRDNPHWWAKNALGLAFKFNYLCDLVSPASGKGLAELLDGSIDWSNQLLRGVTNLAASRGAGYGIKTYYSGPPYMISAATAWLEMDLARSPMNNVDFRRAVAYALDPGAVAQGPYTGTVEVAGATGLLPELSSWVDARAVKKLGFYFSPSLAKKYLARSGYRGQSLVFLVPQGQVDLLEAAQLLAKQLAKVGISVSVHSAPEAALRKDINSGNFDMVINSQVGLSATPWQYFETVYRLPIPAALAAGDNTERMSDPGAWALVQQAARTPLTDSATLGRLYDTLQSDFLDQLPEIPLWYTGAWFQASTRYWQGYPSSITSSDRYTPVMWPGWLGSTTTVLALAHLRRR